MTYDELVAAALSYADRNDVEVTGMVNEFILMAEAHMNRVLKTREQTARAFTPIARGQDYYSLPPDYRGMRDIQFNSQSPLTTHKKYQINYLSPSQMNAQARMSLLALIIIL